MATQTKGSTRFQVGQRVRMSRGAQGVQEGEEGEVVDVRARCLPFGEYVVYTIRWQDGLKSDVQNGHLLLDEVKKLDPPSPPAGAAASGAPIAGAQTPRPAAVLAALCLLGSLALGACGQLPLEPAPAASGASALPPVAQICLAGPEYFTCLPVPR